MGVFVFFPWPPWPCLITGSLRISYNWGVPFKYHIITTIGGIPLVNEIWQLLIQVWHYLKHLTTTRWCPPNFNLFFNPHELVRYITNKNHSYGTYVHQLSYRTGAPPCTVTGVYKPTSLGGPTLLARYHIPLPAYVRMKLPACGRLAIEHFLRSGENHNVYQVNHMCPAVKKIPGFFANWEIALFIYFV